MNNETQKDYLNKDLSWFFQDFKKGGWLKTEGRTVTETDISLIIGVTGHSQPIFVDELFAQKTSFGTRIAPGELTIGLLAGLLAKTGALENQVGLLEITCKFPNALKANDTVYAESEIVETKLNADGNRGVVTFHDRLFNQDGEDLLLTNRTALFLCRSE